MDPSGQDSCSKCGKAFGASPSYLFIGKRYCLECFRAAREEASKRVREQEKTYDTPAATPGAGVYRLDDILPALRKHRAEGKDRGIPGGLARPVS